MPVIDSLVTLARSGDGPAYSENALRETLVSAWPGLEGFKKAAALRARVYRIAINRCLNELRDRADGPVTTPELRSEPPSPTCLGQVPWLEPYPDDLIEALPDAAPGPDPRYETRESLGLSFIAALQHLPAPGRSVLVLRDVLGYRAAEVADMLNTSEASVENALQQARAALEARLGPSCLPAPAPRSPRERELAESFADGFEQGNIDRVVSLLTDNATVTMPPDPFEYRGRETIGSVLRHLAATTAAGHTTKLVPTRANGQPAFGHYILEPGAAAARGTGLFVLTIEGDRIAAITRFGGEDLLPRFGLPPELQA